MLWKNAARCNKERQQIASLYLHSEEEVVASLIEKCAFSRGHHDRIQTLAMTLTKKVREESQSVSAVASLVQHYDLSSEEGIVLMCVAEALLRIPDAETEKLLISDKLSGANWEKHLGVSESSFVNASTWGLAISGKILSTPESTSRFKDIWKKMLKKSTEGIIRQAVRRAVKLMSEEFVLGRSLPEAIKRGKRFAQQGYTFSFDMLGEAALTKQDAEIYFKAYANAIEQMAKHVDHSKTIFERPGMSVKLSALWPRYEFLQQESAIAALAQSLKKLALSARDLGIALLVDAEEAERLDMSLEIFQRVFSDPEFAQWEGLGLAVQAYQKRAYPVLEWLIALSEKVGKRVQCRLVKGAYWDTEIKHAQMHGWTNYPVFTRKVSTDISYCACAELMLNNRHAVFAKFATHNAHTVATLLTMLEVSGDTSGVEFQNLQGMGKSLHAQILQRGIPCRIYAPVGHYEDLLPYLVRRLLENGANSSFVNQIANKDVDLESLIESPLDTIARYSTIPHAGIPLPSALFGGRKNSHGVNLSNWTELVNLQSEVLPLLDQTYTAQSTHHDSSKSSAAAGTPVYSPAEKSDIVGHALYANAEDVNLQVERSVQAFSQWNTQSVDSRALAMEAMADLLEENRATLIALLIREAGKVITDALDEIREAVDFCRYYAAQARELMQERCFTGYTGETNVMTIAGRGVFACISPWNFPVAIFVGQVAAALVTGNTVIAKPAEQTSLVASFVVDLFHKAGVSKNVLQLLLGPGTTVGQTLISHTAIAGVVFTGSTSTAKIIQRQLSAKDGAIVPLIAETGGLNVMVADSSALTEQLVADVVESAFGAAGQRCSALRVLLIQEDVADKTIAMLKGALELRTVGHPRYLDTDMGPVIDDAAMKMLRDHESMLSRCATCLYKAPDNHSLSGHYFQPQVHEISDLDLLKKEVFGPILHIKRYKARQLPDLLEQVNRWGYGLTCGVHSRINKTISEVTEKINAGNVYVNRNMIGAVVGLQPFGGSGLSGTGPKAGGPFYLPRFCQETVVSTDTTATGGNASLMALDDLGLSDLDFPSRKS